MKLELIRRTVVIILDPNPGSAVEKPNETEGQDINGKTYSQALGIQAQLGLASVNYQDGSTAHKHIEKT